ncbi:MULTISPECIES: FkbM family methyltransferase [Giesbergeria]|uniref:FkbM family methyltransferase n=1 Tax=Giesbergeria sinuosa TaxID=80883 RepID=A0ABV9QH75_9BURK
MLRNVLASVFQSSENKNTQNEKSKTISHEYAQLNAQLHLERSDYGTSGRQWATTVQYLLQQSKSSSVLDYGCGKQTLAQSLPDIKILGFDPAIPGLDKPPMPSDLLVCTDVLEHVEPEFIDHVLDDLSRLTKKIALITVATRPAVKKLADGRNAHLTVQPFSWWQDRFEKRFDIIGIKEQPGFEFALILRGLNFQESIIIPEDFKPFSKKEEESNTTPSESSRKIPVGVVKHGDNKILFTTPNQMTAWRVNSFYEKEPHTVRWLESIPKDSVFLDIGANVGMYSIFAAVVSQAKVYAFEPESQNYAALNQNISINKLSEKLLAFPLAISNKTGADKLFLSGFDTGGSCHSFGADVGFDLKPRGHAFVQGAFSTTIDELVATGTLPIPDFVKIDVDGFEHKVIEGAQKTLKDPKVKSVIIELNTKLPEHKAAAEMLEKLGFFYDNDQVMHAQRKSGAFEGVAEFIFWKNKKEISNLTTERALGIPTSMQARAVMNYAIDKILSTAIADDPFPYLVVDNIFPPDYYQQILANFPGLDAVRPLSESGRVQKGSYKERLTVLFNPEDFSRMSPKQIEFWSEFASWLYSEAFLSAVIFKFRQTLESRISNIINAEGKINVRGDALLVNDQTNYAIGPHTDAPHRLVTFLFYMPENDKDRDLGTSIYLPKKEGFTCWGGPHYPHDQFDLVDTVEFLPNRLLMFPKTEKTFHGVEPVLREGVNRKLLINNIRILNKTTH